MKRTILTLAALGGGLAGLTAAAPQAQAAFYFEGLAPYTAEPRCNDPYAMDKSDCEHVQIKPRERKPRVEPEPRKKPDVRWETRDGLKKK